MRKIHVNWGHASARQLKRIRADAEGANGRLLGFADKVVVQREVCQDADKARRLRVAAAPSACPFYEKPQV